MKQMRACCTSWLLSAIFLVQYRAVLASNAQGANQAGWAEVDLVTEFGLPPRANVHFLMTTGKISGTQAALYVAETTSSPVEASV